MNLSALVVTRFCGSSQRCLTRVTALDCLQAVTTSMLLLLVPALAIAQDDLDAQLLEELGGDLFEPEQVPAPPNGDRPDQDASPPAGEDIGAADASDDSQSPLAAIGARMRSAEQLLRDQNAAGGASKLQQKIVSDLDAMIEQLRKQQRKPSQGGGAAGGASQRSQSKPQGQQGGGGKPQDQNGKASANQNPDGSGGAGQQVDMQSMNDIIKNVWGHLPAKAREQVIQRPFEEFLPKYELEIEQYFRRLSEDPQFGR